MSRNTIKVVVRAMAYPIANVRQSEEGARDVIAIWSIVLNEICSEVVGSKRMIFPLVLPESHVLVKEPSFRKDKLVKSLSHQMRRCRCASKQLP